MGAKPPPTGPMKSIDIGGFQAPRGSEPPALEKKFKPPLEKFLNTPLIGIINLTRCPRATDKRH